MKHAFKLFFKAFGFVVLCIAFLFLWNSLRISKAFEEGAMQPSTNKECVDSSYVETMKSGEVQLRKIDMSLARYITRREGSQRIGAKHASNFLNILTLTLFYSERERRNIHEQIVDNLKICSHRQ